MTNTAVDLDRLRYLRIVTEAYMSWRRGGVHLGMASAARVIGIPQPVENRRVIDLSTDDFTLIDRRYAKLEAWTRAVLDVEYNESGSVKQKARFFGVDGDRYTPDEYRAAVLEAETVFYVALLPQIEWWEQAKPMRRRTA